MSLVSILNDSLNSSHYYACRSGLGKTAEACAIIEHALTKGKGKSTLVYAAKKRSELLEVLVRVRRTLIESKAQHASRFLNKIFIKFTTDFTPEQLEPFYSSTEYTTSEKDYVRNLIISGKIKAHVRYKNDKEELCNASVILTTHESLTSLLVTKAKLSRTIVLLDETPEHLITILGETKYAASTLIGDASKRTKDNSHSLFNIPNKKLRPLLDSSLYTISVINNKAILHLNSNHKCLKVITMSASIDGLFLYNHILPKPLTLTENKDNSKAVQKFISNTFMSYTQQGDLKNKEMQALLYGRLFHKDTLVINPASLHVTGGEQIRSNMVGSNTYSNFTKVFVASQMNLSTGEWELLSGLLSDSDIVRYESLKAGCAISQSIYRCAVRTGKNVKVKIEFISSQAKLRFEDTLNSYKLLVG